MISVEKSSDVNRDSIDASMHDRLVLCTIPRSCRAYVLRSISGTAAKAKAAKGTRTVAERLWTDLLEAADAAQLAEQASVKGSPSSSVRAGQPQSPRGTGTAAGGGHAAGVLPTDVHEPARTAASGGGDPPSSSEDSASDGLGVSSPTPPPAKEDEIVDADPAEGAPEAAGEGANPALGSAGGSSSTSPSQKDPEIDIEAARQRAERAKTSANHALVSLARAPMTTMTNRPAALESADKDASEIDAELKSAASMAMCHDEDESADGRARAAIASAVRDIRGIAKAADALVTLRSNLKIGLLAVQNTGH